MGFTGKRAKHFYDKLIHELEDKCAFSLQLWNFQVLAIPELRESVVKSAARQTSLSFHVTAKLGFLSTLESGLNPGPS